MSRHRPSRFVSRSHKAQKRSQPSRRRQIEQLEPRLALSVNPIISVPTTLVGARGGIISVPVYLNQITGASGLSGLKTADLAIDFDPSVFTVSTTDVHLGVLPANDGTNWTSFVSLSAGLPGQMGIHLSFGVGGSAITNTYPAPGPPSNFVSTVGDSLVVIDFHIKTTAALATTRINIAASNSLATVGTNLVDALGRKYTLGIAPTNAATDAGVDGAVSIIAASAPLGTWTAGNKLNIQVGGQPATVTTMLLLTNGDVIANGDINGNPSNAWFELTPDVHGNYANGTWTQIASANLGRDAFGSVVLQDGRVMIMGGEYTSTNPGVQAEDGTGEIYDPVANTWTQIASYPATTTGGTPIFGDGQLDLLSDGTVLGGNLTTDSPSVTTSHAYRYNPQTDVWTQDALLPNGDNYNEEGWTKLPDGSILTVQIGGSKTNEAQRLVFGATPELDQWVDAGRVPVTLATTLEASGNGGYEVGTSVLLNDGREFYIGATGNTAFYTPPTAANPQGTWAIGPVVPYGLGANDAPAAVMPNGRVLFVASSTPEYGPNVGSKTIGTTLFEYDPVTNVITPVTNLPPALATAMSAQIGQFTQMLMLPSGQVMFSYGDGQTYLYTPAGKPSAAWQPTISTITTDDNVTYTLTGTQLNGLSEGAYYGDDAQMATNYPIIELTKSDGTVAFATTFNWSTANVATGSAPETVQFTLPAGTELQDYVSLKVVANGIASLPTDQDVALDASDPDIVVQVQAGNPNVVQVLSNGIVITTHANNNINGGLAIIGDTNDNSVTINEANGLVQTNVRFDGGGFVSAGDQFSVVGGATNDAFAITPNGLTGGKITDNASAAYSFTNVQGITVDGGAGGTDTATFTDTTGNSTLDVNGLTLDYGGGSPYSLLDLASLKVTDSSTAGNDTINVLSTAIPTTVGGAGSGNNDKFNVGSDMPTNAVSDLTGILAPLVIAPGAGKNTLTVSDVGSVAPGLNIGLTKTAITADDLASTITYSQGTGTSLSVVLDGSNNVATTFTVRSTLAAGNSVVLNAGAIDGNTYNIGSSLAADNGVLNSIPAAITINGSNGVADSLEVDDHGTTGAYNYDVSDSTVTYDKASSPSPVTFGGVTYSGISTLEVDGTDQPNSFVVAPSFTTTININGNAQTGGADSLQISTAGVTGSPVNTSSPMAGHPGSFVGNFSFSDGHQNVNYSDIESFPTPSQLISFPILAYAPDAGAGSQPLIKVVNARTGALVSSFLAYESTYTGGVSLAVGYFDGSGQPEIAVAPGRSHTPLVKVYDAFGNLKFSFMAYASTFINGVNIAAGNIEGLTANGHELDDIVTSPTRGVSDIRVWHNQDPTVPATPMTLTREFTVWGTTFIGGSTVAIASLKAGTPGAWADILVGSGSGMTGTIDAFDVTLAKTTYAPFKAYTPFGTTYRGGINISATDPLAGSNISAPMIVASEQVATTSAIDVLNGLTGALVYTTTATPGVGSSTGVHTTARIIDGVFYVFYGQGTNGLYSKIERVNPLNHALIDFLLETDPTFARLVLA